MAEKNDELDQFRVLYNSREQKMIVFEGKSEVKVRERFVLL